MISVASCVLLASTMQQAAANRSSGAVTSESVRVPASCSIALRCLRQPSKSSQVPDQSLRSCTPLYLANNLLLKFLPLAFCLPSGRLHGPVERVDRGKNKVFISPSKLFSADLCPERLPCLQTPSQLVSQRLLRCEDRRGSVQAFFNLSSQVCAQLQIAVHDLNSRVTLPNEEQAAWPKLVCLVMICYSQRAAAVSIVYIKHS